jgi:photosystem II stability/assembly factor-like uncharacterized protein
MTITKLGGNKRSMKKLTKIFGIGLVVVLLVSLFGFAAPASAGTLSWSSETIPDTTGNVTAKGTDITDVAVSGDGGTIYVTSDGISPMGVGSANPRIFKSVNDGESWSQISLPSGINSIQWVSVAPDDPDVVAFVGNTNEVYVSTDGGTNWKTALKTVVDTTTSNSSGHSASTIFDIDVSVAKSGVNYLGVVGIDSNSEGNLWYYNLGVGGYWHETKTKGGFNTTATAVSSADSAAAIKFSPNFNSDSVLTAVTFTDNGTHGIAHFQMFSENTGSWNNAAGFGTGYPVAIASDTAITSITKADIALAPTYLGSDDVERVAFVGLSFASSQAKSGVVRLKDDSDKLINDGNWINSVAYDGSILAAGHLDSNAVRFTDEPLATTPTFSSARSNKRPQGTDYVVLAWAGDKLIAGTSGDESSFCVSENNGLSFNGLSLIDTNISSIEDIGISSDGTKIYMATSDNGSQDLSIWRKASSWVRVLSDTGSTGSGYLVRMAPDNTDVVYVAQKNDKTIFYTADAGEEKWFTRTARYALDDLTVENEDTAYIAIDDSTAVSKTTNGGFTWGSSKDTKLSSGNIYTIRSLGEDMVIVGSDQGYVSYSTDGGSNWIRIEKQVTGATSDLQVTASGLSDGDFIYAAGKNAGTDVRRWEIGTSTAWTNLEATANSTDKAYGISLFDGVLYVALSDSVNSKVIRTLSPSVDTPLASYWSSAESSGEAFIRAPSALTATSSGDYTKLWAVNDENGINAADELFSFTDILAKSGPNLAGPVDDKRIAVNAITGYANDVSLIWEQPPKGRSYTYDIWVAFDSGFVERLLTESITSSSSKPNIVIDGSNFNNGTTYYWRVRVATNGPLKSPWSETRSFTIEPGSELVPNILSPVNGATNTKQKPSFSWSPVSGATKYRFVLANNAQLTAPLVDITTTNTAYAVTTDLAYGETYYWAVRSVDPVEGSWSAISNFTVMEEPKEAPPPVEVKEVPPPIINIPAPPPAQEIVIPPAPPPPAQIAPAYIWAVIIIGAVLVIAVIVLIVRTRRTSV